MAVVGGRLGAKKELKRESGEHEVRFIRKNTGVGGRCAGTVGFREYYVSLVETNKKNSSAFNTPRRA